VLEEQRIQRRTRSIVRFGSFSTELGCPCDVRFPPDSHRIADIAGGPFRARLGLERRNVPVRAVLSFVRLCGAVSDNAQQVLTGHSLFTEKPCSRALRFGSYGFEDVCPSYHGAA
jgi:hypothetical protein